MMAALGDAAWMAAMERNSDLVVMQCYAPMLVNVNPGGRQWRPNLIGYDALHVFGSPSYCAIQMFNRNRGDQIISDRRSETHIQSSATRDSSSGEIFVKLVNAEASDAPVTLDIKGVTTIEPTATATTLSADPTAYNTVEEPKKVAPVTTTVQDVKTSFTYNVPAHGIVILKLKAK
jgi:alpha-N-arabinofuranosidase